MNLYSESCERNKGPIFDVIKDVLAQSSQLLEIGSGTGQHALYMAAKMPHLQWRMTDFGGYLEALKRHFDSGGLTNIVAPTELDVRQLPWSQAPADMIFTSNSLHIMGWDAVECFFAGVGQTLQAGGHLVVYGPFKYEGQFTTPSNAQFDLWLKDRDPVSGVRDFEAVDALAKKAGLSLMADHAMPANNQCLLWQRLEGQPSATE